ncbi:transmembrane protein, putative (macronuclear) [Tetrahymena thermophila SB210]|uniref:Transmembrane protein, putative n=1 Tax=Tetrahymena thermophila (strain SB210) TaxID=312017 RepID=W7X9V9_TETTS|nr:transmembrane protein, putative [Tetrahymena thermophila SB210]EWS74112.1 transmembrane protein, putative [Tetrahymena thermophila SB210]|eukprot:XP_012653367.1 transmembrane protein, putative [Tetrahymena thermophila SB210]
MSFNELQEESSLIDSYEMCYHQTCRMILKQKLNCLHVHIATYHQLGTFEPRNLIQSKLSLGILKLQLILKLLFCKRYKDVFYVHLHLLQNQEDHHYYPCQIYLHPHQTLLLQNASIHLCCGFQLCQQLLSHLHQVALLIAICIVHIILLMYQQEFQVVSYRLFDAIFLPS